MKSIKQKSSKSKLMLGVSIALVIFLVAGAGFIYYTQSQNKQAGESTLPLEADNNNSLNNQTPSTNQPVPLTGNETDNSNKSTTGEQQPDTAGSANILITAVSTSSPTIQIRTLIDRVTPSGTCTLTLSHANKTPSIKKTAAIQQGPSSSTCQGFDIAKSTLEPGSWTVVITYEAGDQSGTSQEKIFII